MYTWNPTMSVIKNGRKVYTRQGGRWTRDLPYNITQFFSSVFPAAGESYSSFRRGTSIPLWAFFPPSRYTGTHMHVLASKESRRVSKAYGREKKKQFNSKKKKHHVYTRVFPFCFVRRTCQNERFHVREGPISLFVSRARFALFFTMKGRVARGKNDRKPPFSSEHRRRRSRPAGDTYYVLFAFVINFKFPRKSVYYARSGRRPVCVVRVQRCFWIENEKKRARHRYRRVTATVFSGRFPFPLVKNIQKEKNDDNALTPFPSWPPSPV